jgi:hypothetical protein
MRFRWFLVVVAVPAAVQCGGRADLLSPDGSEVADATTDVVDAVAADVVDASKPDVVDARADVVDARPDVVDAKADVRDAEAADVRDADAGDAGPPCEDGAACTRLYDECHFDSITCQFGFPQCLASSNAPDETRCEGGTCCGGECVNAKGPAACTPACKMCPDGGKTCPGVKCNEYGFASEFVPCGNSISGVDANYLLAAPVTVPAITLTGLGVFGNKPTAGIHGVLALYTDVGGAPGTLVAQTAPALMGDGDNLVPVESSVPLKAGTYFVAGVFDQAFALCTDSNAVNTLFDYVPDTYPNVPASFGPPNTVIDAAINYYIAGTH